MMLPGTSTALCLMWSLPILVWSSGPFRKKLLEAPPTGLQFIIFDHAHQLLQSSSTIGHTFLSNLQSIERHIDTARVFVVLDAATNDHAGYDGMAILPWFNDNSRPWQGFRIRNSTNALTIRFGWSREKITLLESRLSTIHTQFRFTTHRKAATPQGNRVSILSSSICTIEWLQLTQRTNSGRSSDWPKRTESFGFVSQWDWTFIRYIELVLAQLDFYMKQHSAGYGYIQTDTCPIQGVWESPAPLVWDMPWQVIESAQNAW